MTRSSLPALLQERASNQPDAAAYTFFDYETNPAGFASTLTWGQVHRRARTIAEELLLCGSPGDRAAILAPQGLEYVIAFLGALEAGFIAVPLAVPLSGAHDERISSVLADCAPTVILTTSSTVGDIRKYLRPASGPAPQVVEIDALDLDSPRESFSAQISRPKEAYLQYTSGSTGQPGGVVITHENLMVNLDQIVSAYFGNEFGDVTPPDTFVSWLPFFHDMGLVVGICLPLQTGTSAALMSPTGFLQRPARWIQQLASNPRAFSAAPNFAFDLAANRTKDADMVGLDLGDVVGVINGAERVLPATTQRFMARFSGHHFPESAIRPSYGLAEATVFIGTGVTGQPPKTTHFRYEQLCDGVATPSDPDGDGLTEFVGYGSPGDPLVRIVNPETRIENPEGAIGEIWAHGRNVAVGYWRNPERTERTFGGRIVEPSAGTPEGPWLKTGDLGVMVGGELYIIGRMKDLVIVDGRNHYPDDIEATIREITGGRSVAISVSDQQAEKLVAIVEIKSHGPSDEDFGSRLRSMKREVVSAISQSHQLRVADLVLVSQGAIPITTSGKVRRSACLERYRQQEFARVDVSA
jgi:long chain fatty acid CoA FadD26